MSLIQSVKENNLNDVNRLIREGVDVNVVGAYGRTALWVAAWDGHVECAAALINAKADVNKANENGSTPLHQASISGPLECVRVSRLWGVGVVGFSIRLMFFSTLWTAASHSTQGQRECLGHL